MQCRTERSKLPPSLHQNDGCDGENADSDKNNDDEAHARWRVMHEDPQAANPNP